jgi:hypothetical protein
MAIQYDELGNVIQGDQSSPELENKTDKTSNKSKDPNASAKAQAAQVVDQLGAGNVLNGYRSITYNFTLAGLDKTYLKDPEKYRSSALDLVILKSGGKGYTGITQPQPTDRQVASVQDPVYDRFDAKIKQSNVNALDKIASNQKLVEGFNQESPGRFDMFIENVEVETLMAFSENSNATLPTQLKFEVIEPYSVNGFLEALHVAAVSAGYLNYQQASFLLKMEFWGYPDDDVDSFRDPEIIPDSTRYFPIGLTGIDIDITERGTRYRCTAVPINERAFGEPNKIKKPIKMAGSTIKEILTNLMENVNKQVARIDKDGKEETTNNHNRYFIKFPKWDESSGWSDTEENDIGKSKLLEIFKDNALYAMADPSTVTPANAYKANGSKQPSPDSQAKAPESFKYNPGKTVIQFAEGHNLHDIISAVIRDSEYIRNILKDVKSSIDTYGMVKYFLVKIEVTNQDVIDEVSKKPFQDFTFVVTPYRIHYTRIPTYGQEQIKEETLKKLSLREYNYIYTGKNIDVLNFKLSFNTLFFEAVPAAMGNRDIPSAKTGAGPTNDPQTKTTGTAAEKVQQQQVPVQSTKVDVSQTQAAGGNAGQPLDDPYAALAKNLHNAMINSKANMIEGELEILGDPFYLATGGVGNFNPKPASDGVAKDGSALHTVREVLITINFRNPVDYGPDGMMYFDPRRVAFSGVYRVIQVSHTFKDGVFKQRLKIIRVPGQVLDQNITPSDPANRIITKPAIDDQVTPDATRASNPSMRMNESTAIEQLNRGLPTPGLPGIQSNFTNATGGLGGASSSLLSQTAGAVSRVGALAAGSAIIGKALPTDVASNIRLNSSGLASLGQSGLSTAALVAVASNVLTGNIPSKRAVGVVAGALTGAAISAALKKPNAGSGIGEGSTVSIPAQITTVSADLTANEIKSGAGINPVSLPAGSLSNVTGSLTGLKDGAVKAVTQLGTDIGNLASGVGDKVKSLLSTPADPAGVAATVGINASAISGIGAVLPSGVSKQVTDLVKNTPENVNLNQAAAAGLVLDYIPASKVANIPPPQPYTVAQPPQADVSYLKQVVAAGGTTALENLYGVTNISKLSSNVLPTEVLGSLRSSIPGSQLNPLASVSGQLNSVDANVIKDKLASAKSQISGISGLPNIPDQQIAGSISSKFGSSSYGQSPLDKLVNKLGDPNAPPYTGDDPIVRARLGLPPTQ